MGEKNNFESPEHYCFSSSIEIVVAQLKEIKPPTRSEAFNGFISDGVSGFRNEDTVTSIKNAMKNGIKLPPIKVFHSQQSPYKYKVKDGYHRFYISKILGFTKIPITIDMP